MFLNGIMEGDTNLISSIRNLETEGKEHGTIKALLKNFILPDTNSMAIKDNQQESKCVYSVPIKTQLFNMNERLKSINDAKKAFLNSTVDDSLSHRNNIRREEPTLHYAQIAITTDSDDTRSTGGGMGDKKITKNVTKKNNIPSKLEIPPIVKKATELHQRKVSFKIKNSTTSYKRPPTATKSTMIITKTNVAELTKKFNNLVVEPETDTLKRTRLAKTIEELQSASRSSTSNHSTPSSTLSSNQNIKIVLRPRRGSRKRNNSKKRCSSMDSIDKYINSEKSPSRVLRSKSDGNKIPKSPKKRLKNHSSNEQQSYDTVDGILEKATEEISAAVNNQKQSDKIVVKNVIKKFECEIIAQNSNITTISNNNTLKKTKPLETPKSTPLTKEKPKVPEKKSTLTLTKNLVVKDGVPMIKTIRHFPSDLSTKLDSKSNVATISKDIKIKKQPIYDRKKFKTNYIHTDKMPLHVVEIIHEDVGECNIKTNPLNEQSATSIEINKSEVESESLGASSENLAPNESFLWRRKSYTQIYSDSEKCLNDCNSGPHSITTVNGVTVTTYGSLQEVMCNLESQVSVTNESQESDLADPKQCDKSSDFESNLVEACNKEVLVGFTIGPKNQPIAENEYEVLEPKPYNENIVVIPVNTTLSRPPKINCPLPEIPKSEPKSLPSPPDSPGTENIYQCLLEMRSHPEGDENSIHSYELYDAQLDERTRGDGDSDDGYEYCKSPIKPFCVTSSSGIQIAEDYKPSSTCNSSKNYAIKKSVSGTSTASYEKIGSERIYEKIPCRTSKSKNNSPISNSSRHSIVSSDYTGYNDHENIYDTIKHSDGTSLSNCYESIPNSPSMVKLRNNLRKQLASAVQKRLSFDNESNLSHSTMSSEQKTNSIYGQRSVISYNGQEIAFQVPSSEVSVSDRSDRSDDWVDVSDEEKHDEQKIIIVRERSKGRKSPISWSQKVRHQRQNTPKKHHKECDSSDSGHLYESLEPAPAHPHLIPEDFDSFDSDSETEEHDKSVVTRPEPDLPASRLPSPPSGGPYTLTKIANAAQRKMRQLKRNLTKRYSVAMDSKSFMKSPTNQSDTYDSTMKTKPTSPIYANYQKPESQVYSNINFNDTRPVLNKTEKPVKIYGSLNEELKTVIGEKRLSNGAIPPPLPEKPPPEKPTTPTSENSKKDNGTLSRKTYFSFKSRFRRATSMAVDINEVPSALKITNSTFYLTDSVDGDSGFSNCSDSGQTSSEALGPALGPAAAAARRDGTRPLSESSPCLALVRPSAPPPPPPALHTDLSAVNEELKRLLPTLSRKEKAPRTRTSWYAECGADSPSTRASTASWYAEAGLYQAGNASSSGASSSSHPASPLPHTLFTHEPLYQFYNAAKLESACLSTGDSDSDTYDASARADADACAGADVDASSRVDAEAGAGGGRPSAMALVAPRGPARTLWCEVPEVLNSTVLSSLAPAQKRLQEAKFELLTSEASYLNSLNVLEAHFASHPAFRDPAVLPPDDWDTLFTNIIPVRRCSQLLMNELEKCWQENILLSGICEVVREHADKHFHVYVKYCEGQALMVKTLQRLRERPNFATALARLESHPACQSLSLHSFLLLPMQRATRLPLLLDAVLRHLSPQDQEYHAAGHALATLNHWVMSCNEGARNADRVEEMFRLRRAIEFPTTMHGAPDLAPACTRRDRRPVRYLVRSGEMTHLVYKTDELKLTFGKKFHKTTLHLFLFNDHLVIAKKKGEESYVAVEHCPRSLLEVCGSEGGAGAGGARHALLLTLLENHEGRTVEMLMSVSTETELSRWWEALCPALGGGEGEAVYAGWDCPQVAALYAYHPQQPDELHLTEGDIVNVTRKTAEGWYYGERTRDGEAGWFPGAYSVEIASAHVRARNLRQRYRLLALSATYRGAHRKRNT